MPTRIVATGGGNWNATSTWVGGVVPIQGDDIIGNASSGNLTINVATANMQSFNFENYLQTLTINASMTCQGGTRATFSTSATMSITTSSSFSETNCINIGSPASGSFSMITNGKVIPYLRFTKNAGGLNAYLLDQLNLNTLSVGLGNNNVVFNTTYSIFCQHLVKNAQGGGNQGSLTGNQMSIFVTGASGSFTNLALTDPTMAFDINLVINVDGNFQTIGPFVYGGRAGLTPATKLEWRSGTLTGDKILGFYGPQNPNRFINVDLVKATTWSSVNCYQFDNTSAGTIRWINLESNLQFDRMNFLNDFVGADTDPRGRRPIGFTGSARFIGNDIFAFPDFTVSEVSLSGVPNGTPTSSTPALYLHTAATYSINNLRIMGNDFGLDFKFSNTVPDRNSLIASGTPGTRAKIDLTGTNPLIFTTLQDIDAVGNTIYTYGGSVSNTNNVQIATIGGAGGGEKSTTFVV